MIISVFFILNTYFLLFFLDLNPNNAPKLAAIIPNKLELFLVPVCGSFWLRGRFAILLVLFTLIIPIDSEFLLFEDRRFSLAIGVTEFACPVSLLSEFAGISEGIKL
ncbi:hypothetical protein DLD91_01625 [Lactobacillus johnsonii]|jgi:hypothetical protein|nr:hypothetical protein DLD91_01625 [Lactobacillus johnsonii]